MIHKQTLLLSASLAAMLALPTLANAADAVIEPDPAPPEPIVQEEVLNSGWYIAGRIGAAFSDDTEFGVAGTTVTNEYDTGYNLSAAVGYDFNNGAPLSFRAEAELGYLSQDIDQHNVAGVANFSGSDAFGTTSSIYGLANAYVDYNLGGITPFVTAGLGYASLDFDGHGVTPLGVVMDSDSGGLAWQVGAGAAFNVTETLKLDLSYRYFGIEDVGLTAVDGTSSDVDLRNHQVTLGIRKMF